MGCVFSKTDINDLHPNIFQVMNLDELGNLVNPGKLEITETDLVLYRKENDPVKWPLRCLRRYGFDAELFSFECGRRCPTGPGIYAFSCQRAEQLFNLLQTHIQVRNNAGEDAVSQEFPAFSPQGPAVASRSSIGGDTTYFEPPSRPGVRGNVPNSIRFSSQNGGGSARLGSVGSSSNGPLSPQTASPSPPPVGIPPVVPVLPVTSINNPVPYYANGELFLAATTCSSIMAAPTVITTMSTTTTTITTTVAIAATTTTMTTATTTTTTPVSQAEPPERCAQQPQPLRTLWQPCLNSETVNGSTVVPSDGNKSACQQRVGSGDGITINSVNDNTSCTQAYSSSSYMNVDLSTGVEPSSRTCSLDGESSYVHLQLKNDVQRHLYMNVIPGPENGVPSAVDKPSTTIRPKPPLPCFGKLQEEWELEEIRHCYANLDPGEIEVARSHLPKRLSATERVPPLPLLSSTAQSQQNPMTPPPTVIQTVNYIELDLEKNKTDLVIGNSNSPQQPKSPVGSVPPSTLSLSPDSPSRASEGYATIDFYKTVALSHSVNPSADNDSEGSRRTRHNSTINDLVAPSTRLSCSE